MGNKVKKFEDKGEQILNFGDEFLIECPKCSSMAKVFRDETDMSLGLYSPQRLVCSKCGFAKKRKEKSFTFGESFDWYFQEPLWLRINCCGETLWAYNEKHLDFIEKYVSAKLRERGSNKNRSLSSRLPKWIKSAKNRDEILKAIGKLRKKLHARN